MTKLWQKTLKIKHGFQKFLCGWIVLQNWFFWCKIFFARVIFCSFFPKMMDQKVTPAKKISKMKNQFFHAHQPRAEIYDFCTQQNCNLSFLYWGVHSFAITLYIPSSNPIYLFSNLLSYYNASSLSTCSLNQVASADNKDSCTKYLKMSPLL